MVYSFFNSNKYGFEGLISAPSALKIFEIHIVFLQIFALTERKSSPSKLLRIWNAIDYVQSGISSLQAYFRMSKRKMPECAWDIVFQTYSIAVKKTILFLTKKFDLSLTLIVLIKHENSRKLKKIEALERYFQISAVNRFDLTFSDLWLFDLSWL